MKNLSLRPYQVVAVNKIIESVKLNLDGGDIVVATTGAGKSLLIAESANRLNCNVLVIQPTAVILDQNVEKMQTYVEASDIGIFSASRKSKEIKKYTFGTIQTLYKNPALFKECELVIIDECHTLDPKAKSNRKMFQKLISGIEKVKNQKIKVIGLTATPYRLETVSERISRYNFIAHTSLSLIQRHFGGFWKRFIFVMNHADLVAGGYLVPLRYNDLKVLKHSDIRLNKSGTNFDEDWLDAELTQKESYILTQIEYIGRNHKSVLVFCQSVRQAEKFKHLIQDSAIISAKTPNKARNELIGDFKDGKIKYMFNVGVLTTGFDFPELDCICLIKSINSIALYYQIMGRGCRVAQGKTHCDVYDFGGSYSRFGRIEDIKVELCQEVDNNQKTVNKWDLTSIVQDNLGNSRKINWHKKNLYSYEIDLTPTTSTA